MAKRDRRTTAKKIERRLKEGRGQGTGAEYRPWLQIQDVPSLGLAHRILGLKTKRIHHFLSNQELRCFLMFEWMDEVIDIREQYPLLPLLETQSIAVNLGVKHPADPRSREPIVMTTDFLVTFVHDGRQELLAFAVKASRDLYNPRVKEKLEIERRYWEKHAVRWEAITELQIPAVFVANLDIIRPKYDLSTYCDVPADDIRDIAHMVSSAMQKQALSLRAAAAACDRQLGYPRGTSLAVAYHLLATKQWRIDMRVPLDPSRPLNLLATNKQS